MTKTTRDSRAKIGSRTRLVHAGRTPFENHGFVNTPIYRGSTVLYPTIGRSISARQYYTYGTHGTPTTDSLETAWTELPARPARYCLLRASPRSRWRCSAVLGRRTCARDRQRLSPDPQFLRRRS